MLVRQRVVDMRLIDVVLERVRQAEKQKEQDQVAGTLIKSYLLGSGSGGSRTPSTEEGHQEAAHGTNSVSGSGVAAAAVRNATFAYNDVGSNDGGNQHHDDEYKLGYD